MTYKCPKCGGAERRPEAGFLHRLFDCGSIQATSGYTRESAQCLRRQLDAEKAKVKTLRGACQRAQTWLAAFAFNGYGVLCQDDVADHNPIQRELAAALAETETQP